MFDSRSLSRIKRCTKLYKLFWKARFVSGRCQLNDVCY
jgi:hypothetical protein